MLSRLRSRLARTSLRARLTAWNTLVVLLFTIVTLAAARFAARTTLYAAADAELRASATEVALAIRDLQPDLEAVVDEFIRKAESHEERGWFMHLLTEDGMSIWKSDDCPEAISSFPPSDLDRVETVRQVGHFRYVRRRVDRRDGSALLVRVGTYTTGLDESLSGLIRVLVPLGGFICLLTPLVAYGLAVRSTQPVNAILGIAHRLSPTRLGDRLPERGTDDELDRLSQTINRLLDAVAHHMEQQEQFVADAAHELRGPLAALQGSMEVAITRDDLPADQHEAYTDMLEAARHLSKVANDLLLLAELGQSAESRQVPAVDLARIARQAVTMFSGASEDRGIDLELRVDGTVDVRCDPEDLRRLLSNLLDNAVRFTPRGGTVQVRTVAAGSTAILTVRDTGTGIVPADLERVFDRFFKADRARTHGGGSRSGGLGLAICRSIAEACGGTISITSRVGTGTTVTVRLPAEPAPLPEGPQTAAAQPAP
jgi:signal transduction histidine kinase